MKFILFILLLPVFAVSVSAQNSDTLLTSFNLKIDKANTRTDLKNINIKQGKIVLLISKANIGDNLGGFYLFDSNATHTEDTVFMNNIPSNISAVGSWVRVFQKAVNYTQGILVNTGGVKTFYLPGTTNASGQVIVYLTDNNASTGNAIFREIWQVTPQRSPATSSSNAPLVSDAVISADLKTLTITFSKTNATILGTTLLSIAGTVITPLSPAPAGIAVQIKIEGI